MTQKAPGKSYREGITLAQLFKMFPDDETATAWVGRIRWPYGATCPHCGGDNIQHPVKHKTMTHRCRVCRKWFSVRTGTCMESSRLGLQTWVIAIYLLNTGLKGQASMKLHRNLGVTQKTSWHLAHRIRESWEDNGGSLLAGPVEVDETYIGGKRKNMPNKKRKLLTGRGAVGKAAVVGTKDREINESRARHVENTGTANVAGFVAQQTETGAKVYTDDAAVYGALDPYFDREAVNHSVYAPLSSVWEGNDADLLETMFAFYATIPAEPILDSTFNHGRFWKGSSRRVVSMDIDPKYNPMVVCDNRTMEGVQSEAFGVVVYDPPHVGPQGRDKSRKRFDEDFGATMECGKEHGWTLSYLYPPFLEQAKRVLKPDGLLLAKITDMVNNHRSRWAHCDFMRMAEEAGFTVCDLIVKVRTGPMASNKWKTAHHARKRHCFWIICRNGDSCER